MKIFKKISFNWIIPFSFAATILFIFYVHPFWNAIQTNDLANWTTLSLEAGIFLPIAFCLARHFFSKEKQENEQKERKAEILRNDQEFVHLKKIFGKIHLANSNFSALAFHNKNNISLNPLDINPISISLYTGILTMYEKQIHELYLMNPEYFPEDIADGLDNMHTITSEYRIFYDSKTHNNCSIAQLWGSYLVLYGKFIAYEKLRNAIPIKGHEENFKKYTKIYPHDLTDMCGLTKYFDKDSKL